jgi:phosphoribosyl isomerase A
MTVIPVIDLMRGQVVRARGGHRSTYRPIVSALGPGSDPVAMAGVLCRHCATTQLYVADLDALQGGAPQVDVLRALLQAASGLELWVDAGFSGASAAERLRGQIGPMADRLVPVFASESLRSLAVLGRPGLSDPPVDDAILSLDRRGSQRMDPAGCWDAVAHWPRRVIVMTLERVGSDAGPDLDVLRALRAKAPGTLFIGAGGIRDEADLARAADAGASAWLVASALHDGRLPRQRG